MPVDWERDRRVTDTLPVEDQASSFLSCARTDREAIGTFLGLARARDFFKRLQLFCNFLKAGQSFPTITRHGEWQQKTVTARLLPGFKLLPDKVQTAALFTKKELRSPA